MRTAAMMRLVIAGSLGLEALAVNVTRPLTESQGVTFRTQKAMITAFSCANCIIRMSECLDRLRQERAGTVLRAPFDPGPWPYRRYDPCPILSLARLRNRPMAIS